MKPSKNIGSTANLPWEEHTHTAAQVAKFIGISSENFRKMGAKRRPAVQADGRYKLGDVRDWCTKRVKYRELFFGEDSTTIPPEESSTVLVVASPEDDLDELEAGRHDREMTYAFADSFCTKTRAEIRMLEASLREKKAALAKMELAMKGLTHQLAIIDNEMDKAADQVVREVDEDERNNKPLPAYAQRMLVKVLRA